jgi:hypothetical protein
VGCHVIGNTFTVELSADELGLVSANLSSQEYEEGVGLQELGHTRLLDEEVHPALLDCYDTIFA